MHDIARAAYLAKADLVTAAVIEFTSVQGVILQNGQHAQGGAAQGEGVRRARGRGDHGEQAADAKFFYEEDLKQPLDAYVERLDEVVFQEALGTMRDKTERVVKLSAAAATPARMRASRAAWVGTT